MQSQKKDAVPDWLIRGLLFLSCLIIGFWVFFGQQSSRTVVTAPPSPDQQFEAGLKQLHFNRLQGETTVQDALAAAAKNVPASARMEMLRRYAKTLHRIGDAKAGNEVTDEIVKIVPTSPKPYELRILAQAYQDRAIYINSQYIVGNTKETGVADEEKSVEIAQKAFGPNHDETVYKLPTLAVFYADAGQMDKAKATMDKAVAAADDPKNGGRTRWFVYSMKARLQAKQRDYHNAIETLFLVRSIAKNDEQHDRPWEEICKGFNMSVPRINPDPDNVHGLFNSHNYRALDQLSDRLRRNLVVLPEGDTTLDRFYGSLDQVDQEDDAHHVQNIDSLKEWIVKQPTSATAHVALANALTSYAWYARGSDWGSNVPEEGWKPFQERAKQAKQSLDDVAGITSKCPRATAEYSTVSLALDTDQDSLVQMGNACHKNWPNYYFADMQIAYALTPKWGGGQGDCEKYIEKRANQIGGRKGDEFYALLIAGLASSLDDIYQPGSPAHWSRVKAGFKNLFQEYPKSVQLRTMYLEQALYAKDEATAKSSFDGFHP